MDENALGLGKLLDATRDDVVRPGHPLVPDLPLGVLDVDWMPVVARGRLLSLIMQSGPIM